MPATSSYGEASQSLQDQRPDHTHTPLRQPRSTDDDADSGSLVETGVTVTPLTSETLAHGCVNEGQVQQLGPFAMREPSSSTTSPALLSLSNEGRTTSYIPPSPTPSSPALSPYSLQNSHSSLPHILTTFNRKSNDSNRGESVVSPGARSSLFGSSASLAQRRRNMAYTNALTEYEADLTSRDRTKQKDAVRRFLEENIEDEWHWKWPRGANKEGLTFVDELSKTGRSAHKWAEREEWLSNTNDSDDDPAMPTAASPDSVSVKNPFAFESPDDLGEMLKKRELDRKHRRERKLKEEVAYNEGLRCFVERRDAWTGARQVPRRRLTRPQSKNLSAIINQGTEEAVDSDSASDLEEEDIEDDHIELPIAPPLLPPSNAMRASITPAAYNTIYDKVVLQNLAPSCPMPLQDLINSCVHGWKRDGEWPPTGTLPAPTAAKKRRKLSMATIFGLQKGDKELRDKLKDKDSQEKDGESPQSGLRRSFQKFLNLGHREKDAVNGNGQVEKAKESPGVYTENGATTVA